MNPGEPEIRLIDGRFELTQRLGGGGMGLVWRARDNALDREVALKEVRPPDLAMADAGPDEVRQMRERVLREARALARLQHPNVVIIHHIVDSPEHPYPWLVMELVTGGSLAERLARGPLTVPQAARLGRGVLSALRAAHAAGIQHRDVKPGNVLLRRQAASPAGGDDGITPVLTDFGIAAVHGATALTVTGALIGSPEYIAPERIRGAEGGPAADLWSLGMMLYVAVEGHHPLRRSSTLATLAAVLDEPLPPPVRSGPLGPVLSALLAKDPAARPDADRLDHLLAAVADPTTSPAWSPPYGTPPGPAGAWPAPGTPAPGAAGWHPDTPAPRNATGAWATPGTPPPGSPGAGAWHPDTPAPNNATGAWATPGPGRTDGTDAWRSPGTPADFGTPAPGAAAWHPDTPAPNSPTGAWASPGTPQDVGAPPAGSAGAPGAGAWPSAYPGGQQPGAAGRQRGFPDTPPPDPRTPHPGPGGPVDRAPQPAAPLSPYAPGSPAAPAAASAPGHPGPHGWTPPSATHRAGRRGRTPLVVLSATTVVLIGVVAWLLLPDGHGDPHAGGTASAGAGKGGSGGTRTGATSGTGTTTGTSAGTSAPDTADPGTSAPGTADPAVTYPNLLTPAGLRATVAAMRPHLAGAKVKELVVYPAFADAEAPTRADQKLYDDLVYRDGTVTAAPGGTMDDDETTVSLDTFDWNILPGLLAKAQKDLNVPHPTSRYVIISPDLFDNTPTIRVYLSDAYGSGYLSATPKGRVTRLYPRGS